MRKHPITRLKTLLTAACVSLYTKRHKAAKPKYTLEPKAAEADMCDAWMFEDASGLERETRLLSKEMSGLSDSLSDLRGTLDMILGVTPFPVQAQMERPCAMVLHDADLFDGEPLADAPVQDTVIGGMGDFLFDADQATVQSEQHAA